jgi:hypothetical protein
MRDATLARYTGALAAVGGGTWGVAGFFWSAFDGCPEPLCLTGISNTRTAVSLTGLLMVLSMSMLAAAGFAAILVVGRQGALRLPGAVPGAVGAVTCALGLTDMMLILGFSEGSVDTYLEEAGAGILAILTGITLVGCVLLGVRGLSRAVGAFFVIGAFSLASATNDSTPQALLVATSGMCWCAAGLLLLLRTSDAPPIGGSARRSIAAAE